MRFSIKHIIPLIYFIISVGCDDPAPIEISNEEEEVEISVINSEPSSYVITGYDSTGIIDESPQQSSLITFSGIKNTFERITYYKAFAEAVFFDTTKPVFTISNKLLGFRTFDVRNVKFNDKVAVKLPFLVRFRENSIRKDSLLGNKYAVSYRRVISPDIIDFQYNTNLSVEVTGIDGNTNSFNLIVPEEIIGNVSVAGEKRFDNLKIILSWNRSKIGQSLQDGSLFEEVVVGGKFKDRDELVPLFRLGRFRSNVFEIPNSLVEDILRSNNFEYIVFTFLRKIVIKNSANQLGDIRFVSQSIHNIWIKI